MNSIAKDTKKNSLQKKTIYFLSIFLMLLNYLSLFNGINKVASMVVLILLILINDKVQFKKVFPLILMDIIILIMFIYSGNYGGSFNDPLTHAVKFYNITQAYFFYLIFEEIDLKYKKKILKYTLIAVFITMAISIYYNVFIDNTAIRYSDPSYRFIVNFNQYYSGVFIFTTLFYSLLYKKTKNKILISILFSTLLTVFIIGNLVTGLFLALFGVALVFVFAKIKRKSLIFTISSFLMLIGLSLRDYIYILLYNISSWNVFNTITSEKIKAIANLLIGEGPTNTLGRRDTLRNFSMDSFRNNPIFGIGYNKYGFGTVGAHQEWPDLLAVFGIVGTVLIVIILIKVLKNIYQERNNNLDKNNFIIAIVLLLVLGFLNPVLSSEVLIAVLVIAPNLSIICEV